jgi:ATP-dependent Zn protease
VLLYLQMDGFEDNRGLVVLGATNRPGAIDAALIRPGRFDRIIYMPLPDAKGRAEILQVRVLGFFGSLKRMTIAMCFGDCQTDASLRQGSPMWGSLSG